MAERLLKVEYVCIFKDQKNEHDIYADSMSNAIEILQSERIINGRQPLRLEIFFYRSYLGSQYPFLNIKPKIEQLIFDLSYIEENIEFLIKNYSF